MVQSLERGFQLKALIFDVDDTLYIEKDYIRSGFTLLCKVLKAKGVEADVDSFVACFSTNASEAIEKYLKSLRCYTEALHKELLQLHREHIPNIQPFPNVEPLLQKLKAMGIPLGIISDGTALAQNNKLIGLGLKHYFDYIVFSDALGGAHCRKPCDVSFRYIQKQMQIPFENMLYIGDNCDRDFYPVNHLGMRGLQLLNEKGVYYGKQYPNHAKDYYEIEKIIYQILERSMPLRITIDGPVGAGKSTVAAEVAKALNILHLDTGAMYRAFAYACKLREISPENLDAVKKCIAESNISVVFLDGTQQTRLNGQSVDAFIRTPEISMLASQLSKIPEVREKLVEEQRKIASRQDILLDGRDTGSNVLPFAEVKIFLTASPEERARRRFEQNAGGQSYEEILEDLKQRDYQDMTRAVNPLVQAEDAILVDSTDIGFTDTVETILSIVRDIHGK